MSSQICLKWNSFLNNIATSFESLWEEEGLVDVTLASDGQCLTAHKVILSASSPFFKKVFQVCRFYFLAHVQQRVDALTAACIVIILCHCERNGTWDYVTFVVRGSRDYLELWFRPRHFVDYLYFSIPISAARVNIFNTVHLLLIAD